MSCIAERGERRRRGMLGVVAVCGCLLAAVLPAASAQAQGLKAESLRPWRQAMILPKADAGFFLMAAKRGFAEREGLKVDVLEVKDDPIGMKALLSGEVDSYEGVYGAIAASARGADVKLLGCNWHAAPYVMLARPGIGSIEEASEHLRHVDGVMLGRAAYQEPWRLLVVDAKLFGETAPHASMKDVFEAMMPYIARELAAGTRLHAITRHFVGAFHAVPGARAFRRHLAEQGVKAGADIGVLRDAVAKVTEPEATSLAA